MKHLNFLLLFLIASSCATRPHLYPNDTVKKRGLAASEADVDLCMKNADAYLQSSKGKAILKSAGSGALVGGAMGTVAGLFTGNIVRNATLGAAMGGAGGAVQGAITPDQLKHNYVNKCLTDKGYHVLGWD
jgi:uncharacterized membrane protein